jgi:hypothetical protein
MRFAVMSPKHKAIAGTQKANAKSLLHPDWRPPVLAIRRAEVSFPSPLAPPVRPGGLSLI